jgi:hypothetical protein
MISIRTDRAVQAPAQTVRRFGAKEEKIGLNKEAFQVLAAKAAKDAGLPAEQIKDVVEKAGDKFEQLAQQQAPIITNASSKDVDAKTIRKLAGQ